jgi:DnaK suppressor protein
MDELTAPQIAELTAALHVLRGELETQVADASGSTGIVDLDQPIGRISRVDALQQQAMSKEQHRRGRIRLAQVRQALVAVDDDEYGFCRRCEEPIGYRRLKAFPEAPFCVGCRSALERR